jgi:hypothetical protein
MVKKTSIACSPSSGWKKKPSDLCCALAMISPRTLHLLITPIFVVLMLSGCGGKEAETHAEEPAVRQFIERYFSTWSARDMAGYAACFHDHARISFVQNGQLQTSGLTDFLHSQKMSHAQAAEPMTEVPTSMRLLIDDRAALAMVRWKLTKGMKIVLGTDNFSLVKTTQGWRIASLVFYND